MNGYAASFESARATVTRGPPESPRRHPVDNVTKLRLRGAGLGGRCFRGARGEGKRDI
jgi:hypothetical protein